jgi:hypothetical protein
MLVQRAVGRHGGEYRYLFCFSRQNQNCDAPYIQVDDIEGGRPEPLRHHHLPPDFAERSGPSWTRRWPTKSAGTASLRQQRMAALPAFTPNRSVRGSADSAWSWAS